MNRIYDWGAYVKRQSKQKVCSTYIAFIGYNARMILTPQTLMKLQIMDGS